MNIKINKKISREVNKTPPNKTIKSKKQYDRKSNKKIVDKQLQELFQYIFLKKLYYEDTIEFYSSSQIKIGKISNLNKQQNFDLLFDFLINADLEPALLQHSEIRTRLDFEDFLKSTLNSSTSFIFRFKINNAMLFNKYKYMIKSEIEKQHYLPI